MSSLLYVLCYCFAINSSTSVYVKISLEGFMQLKCHIVIQDFYLYTRISFLYKPNLL